ncbi:hypothetical protein FOZ60_012533 [Perkinsus olseni]|uniref:Uncharacterized protein n=1 Tax=Perkinsus olseni TaxID=32597 RepID=A0A7J6P9Q5_PEROL|nr:hypothetical protein FOZ60_012533 [Perkinsus olseni]
MYCGPPSESGVENLPGEPDAAGSPDHLNDALESGHSQGDDGSAPDAQPTSMHRERTVRLNGGSNEDLRGDEEPQGIEVAIDNNIVPRRLAARQSTLQYVAIVLVDKHNTAYRISVFLLLVLLGFICAIQCYAQFIAPVPPTAAELDTLAPETLTNPQNTRYEVTAVGVVESIILGAVGLVALGRAAIVLKKLFMSDQAKMNVIRYLFPGVTVKTQIDWPEWSIKDRIMTAVQTIRSKLEIGGEWFWYGFFGPIIASTLLQMTRLMEQGGRSLTGERTFVADRTAIMTQATIIMLVLVIGPTTLILNNRVWASLFDIMAAFSFTAAYLIVSGDIVQPETWHALHFHTLISFLSSLVPAVAALNNIIGVDEYLLEIARNPALTRAGKRAHPGYYVVGLALWALGIGGYVYVTMSQFKGNCDDLIPRFGEECLLPVYPILDSKSCDCRMALLYLNEKCADEDMVRLSLYNRLEYLQVSNNTTPSPTCTDQSQAILDTVSQFKELVVLSFVATPTQTLYLDELPHLEVLGATATQLTTIPHNIHQLLPSIRSFQFQLSRIEQLPFDSFQQMRYLEYVGLAGNPICVGGDFPEWTNGIMDCGAGSGAACAVDDSLIGLSQSLTGYCEKWLQNGASTLCLPACSTNHAIYSALDRDGSESMSPPENTELLQMFGLVPAGTDMSAALHQCVMESCGREPSDDIAFPVQAVLFNRGETSCEACEF